MLDTNSTSITPGTLPNGYQEVLYYKINKPIRIIVLPEVLNVKKKAIKIAQNMLYLGLEN